MSSSVLSLPTPPWRADEEFALFANSVGKFLDEHTAPEKLDRWRRDHVVERRIYGREPARRAFWVCRQRRNTAAPAATFRHEAVLIEETAHRGLDAWGATLHNGIVMPYIESYGSEEQKRRWLPRLASGELISAIAMTEPGTGSDLQAVKTSARKTGNHYAINGSKTFITNGQTANFIIVVAKTDPTLGAKGVSLVVVETDDAPGFERGAISARWALRQLTRRSFSSTTCGFRPPISSVPKRAGDLCS